MTNIWDCLYDRYRSIHVQCSANVIVTFELGNVLWSKNRQLPKRFLPLIFIRLSPSKWIHYMFFFPLLFLFRHPIHSMFHKPRNVEDTQCIGETFVYFCIMFYGIFFSFRFICHSVQCILAISCYNTWNIKILYQLIVSTLDVTDLYRAFSKLANNNNNRTSDSNSAYWRIHLHRFFGWPYKYDIIIFSSAYILRSSGFWSLKWGQADNQTWSDKSNP